MFITNNFHKNFSIANKTENPVTNPTLKFGFRARSPYGLPEIDPNDPNYVDEKKLAKILREMNTSPPPSEKSLTPEQIEKEMGEAKQSENPFN